MVRAFRLSTNPRDGPCLIIITNSASGEAAPSSSSIDALTVSAVCVSAPLSRIAREFGSGLLSVKPMAQPVVKPVAQTRVWR